MYCWGPQRTTLNWLGNAASAVPRRLDYAPLHSLSLGEGHARALNGEGLGICWGYNPYKSYPLGHGSSDFAILTPTRMYSDLRFAAIDGGSLISCAVTATREVYCWGNGYLGHGRSESTPWPQQVLTPQ